MKRNTSGNAWPATGARWRFNHACACVFEDYHNTCKCKRFMVVCGWNGGSVDGEMGIMRGMVGTGSGKSEEGEGSVEQA